MCACVRFPKDTFAHICGGGKPCLNCLPCSDHREPWVACLSEPSIVAMIYRERECFAAAAKYIVQGHNNTLNCWGENDGR